MECLCSQARTGIRQQLPKNLLPICCTLTNRSSLYGNSLQGSLTHLRWRLSNTAEGELANKERKRAQAVAHEGERAEPVSNVCPKEEQCMRNRQSRQDGGRGCAACLLRLFHNADFSHIKRRGREGKETGSLAGRPIPLLKKTKKAATFIHCTYFMSQKR